MINSMTGFGRAIINTPDKKITIDVRSLNGKSLDIGLKMPILYKEKEAEIRKLAADTLIRGKADININVEYLADALPVSLNQDLIQSYTKELKRIAEGCDIKSDDLMPSILRLPNVLVADDQLGAEEWSMLKQLLSEALNKLAAYRKEEGASIKADFEQCVSNILANLEQIESLAPQRIDRIKDRIKSAKEAHLNNIDTDKNRFEQELIYYIEKLDINEEIVRLKSHCQLFTKEMDNTARVSGKKLGFISQEMGREINTIGSKAQHSEIQSLVVNMKDQLEKIKEQALNVL